MTRRLLVLAFLLAAALPALGQLGLPGEPTSFSRDLPPEIPLLVLPEPHVAPHGAPVPEQDWPFRYGVELALSAGLRDAGRWDEVPSTGELVWRVELASPGAFSLGVVFQEFDVPSGSRVFLYDPDRRHLLGAYGEHDENPNGMLAIQPLPGDRVVIEYDEPAGTRETPRLVVGGVIHDYRDVLAHLAAGGLEQVACLVDINCPAGANHQDVKRAVVWMCGGGGCCSGSILNNTAEDGTPYLLTANHCGDMTNGVFVFQYERTGCGSGSSSQSRTLSGATLLRSSTTFDAQLYRLNQTPPETYEPFLAGWSLDPGVDAPVVGISHPGGMPKKIQIAHTDPFLSNTNWAVTYDVGMVQPGSSGSPLFDPEKRVIGALSTGTNPCGSNFAGYGRFDRFYATGGLATWLDPLGWGVSGIDGYDPFQPYARTYNGDGLNPEILSTATPPQLGAQWTADIDTSAHASATSTVLVGCTAPAEGPAQSFGQLLIDTSSPRHFQHIAPVSGALSQHSFALPSSPALAGVVSYTQSFLFGGPLTATNGLKLILNF